jgi:hypothetical protein
MTTPDPTAADDLWPLLRAIATWYSARSISVTVAGDLALAWETFTDTTGLCEFCTRPRCPECLVCPRCAGDGHSEQCSRTDDEDTGSSR